MAEFFSIMMRKNGENTELLEKFDKYIKDNKLGTRSSVMRKLIKRYLETKGVKIGDGI